MGSNIKMKHLSVDKRSAILKVLSKVKQRVLWKWEDEQLPNKPENVLISKWLPQTDILAHPNTKLFISHCGLGSINEAKYYGVPILGIAVVADQPANLDEIIAEGWGVGGSLNDVTEEKFSSLLNEALNNASYSVTAKTTSNLYRDRPQTALATAVYWVEYVIRHKGAKHMQSPAVHLNFVQYYSLDVIGFILVVIYVVCKIVKKGICLCAGMCKSRFRKSKRD